MSESNGTVQTVDEPIPYTLPKTYEQGKIDGYEHGVTDEKEAALNAQDKANTDNDERSSKPRITRSCSYDRSDDGKSILEVDRNGAVTVATWNIKTLGDLRLLTWCLIDLFESRGELAHLPTFDGPGSSMLSCDDPTTIVKDYLEAGFSDTRATR